MARRVVLPGSDGTRDLGIKPVAGGGYFPHLPTYAKLFKRLPAVTDNNVPDLGMIAALQPDLIIGDTFSVGASDGRKLYKQLGMIAPTAITDLSVVAASGLVAPAQPKTSCCRHFCPTAGCGESRCVPDSVVFPASYQVARALVRDFEYTLTRAN